MKKVIFLILACLLLLSGCTNGRDSITTYPYIHYINSGYTFDRYDRKIDIKEGYVLDEGHSFDEIETDDGYDLILHFTKHGE